jgi:capsular exopolysaccharide synthesis family protein
MPYGGDPGGSMGHQHPLERVLDVIARNDKDVDAPHGAIQSVDARHHGGAALAVKGPAGPEPPWAAAPSVHARAAQSPGELLTSTLRYKWTLILVSILVSAPIVAGIWTQIVPQYRARAEVRVRPIIPRLVFKTDDNGAIPFYDSFVNTQVSMIRSLTVLQRVLDQPAVQQTKWYKNTPDSLLQRLHGDSTPPLERLRDALSVRPRPKTEIIDIAFTDASATEAKLIVDTVLNQYLKYTGESTNEEDERLYRQLVDQYNSLEKAIQGREKVCAELRKTLETQTPEELISAKRLHLDTMQARLNELRNTIALLEWEIAQVPVVEDANGVAVVTETARPRQPEYYLDAEWRRLDLNIKSIQHQIENGVLRPSHPESLRLAKDMEFAKNLLEERETQLDEQWRNRPADVIEAIANTGGDQNQQTLASLKHRLARVQREEQLVRTAFTAEQSEFASLFGSAQLLSNEMSALQHQRELFDAVRQRLDQKTIERNVPGSIDVLMWAFSPSKPDQDRRIVFTAMALCCGLGLGSGAAFLRATRDKTICGFKDMPQPAQAPFLGHVPVIRATKPLGRSLCDEIEQNQFLLIESIRVLRTALLSRLNGLKRHDAVTVLVTSAGEGTGKSSFTMILGKSIAQAGKRVLLIDADFHKMTLSKRFELLDKPGFIEILGDKTRDELPIFPTKTPGLDVMPTGKPKGDHRVFEEISNGAFKSCISRIRDEHNYDVVLLDTSPVLPVADATILAGQVDGTVMVERENVSQRTHVMDALARLNSTGGRLLGTVFVGSFEREHYGYGYGYSYGHHSKGRKS